MEAHVGPPLEFAQLVQDALTHLSDTVHLERHLLAALVRPTDAAEIRPGQVGRALRQHLSNTIEVLRPPGEPGNHERAWRPYQTLKLRYVEGLELSEVQDRLGIAKSQYYLEHTRAVRALASLLWDQWREMEGADAASTAPSTASAQAAAIQLPAPLSSIVGREAELATIADLLLGTGSAGPSGGARLLTLTGPPGIGKTRLALEAAARLAGNFAHGVAFVELSEIQDPRLVLGGIGTALSLEAGAAASAEQLQEQLATRQLLLVLDSFEHLLACGAQIAALVAICPNLRVLVTSRSSLEVYGEVQLPVSPLLVPDRQWMTPAAVEQSEAVRLFVERARAVRPDFCLTPENAAAVAAICVRLDGLPLAIELAAARARVLQPSAILNRLEHRLDLLVGGARNLPPRHHTLRAAFDWSYKLLEPAEQAVFRRLGVFAGGCRLEAAAAVLELVDQAAALPVLESLVTRSLLAQVTDPDGEPRFTMLQTLQEYALERLEESGEAASVRERHAAFFLALAEQAGPALVGAEQGMWLARLERSRDNLLAGLRWLESRGDLAGVLRLAAALWRFWSARGRLSEGRQWLGRALELAGSRAQDESLLEAYARVLHGAAMLAAQQADWAAARALAERALDSVRRVGNTQALAEVVLGLGTILLDQGSLAEAKPRLAEARDLYGRTGDRRSQARALLLLGRLAFLSGDVQKAEPLLIQSAAGLQAAGDARSTAEALVVLADLAVGRGEHAIARSRLHQAVRLLRSGGNRRGLSDVLEAWARLSAAEGRHRDAVRLAGAAAALREAIGTPATAGARQRLETALEVARERMPGATWAAEWSAGRAEPVDHILDRLLPAEPAESTGSA